MVARRSLTGTFGQKFWDEMYRSRSQSWSGETHPHLVGQASELGAGRALDVGSGKGADAIWMAKRGWPRRETHTGKTC